MDILTRQKQSGKKEQRFIPLLLLYGLLAEGVIHIKGVSSSLKTYTKGISHPALRSGLKASVFQLQDLVHKFSFHVCIVVPSRYS